MDLVAILSLVALVIGIAAGVVQVIDYLQKRRKDKGENPTSTPPF